MIPGKYNLTCPQGTTLAQQLTYTEANVPINLTGYEARMQVREKVSSPTVILGLTTDDGSIILGGSSGTITLMASALITADLYPKDYVYDLELESPSGIVYRILEGKFSVTPEVTR